MVKALKPSRLQESQNNESPVVVQQERAVTAFTLGNRYNNRIIYAKTESRPNLQKIDLKKNEDFAQYLIL